MLYTTLKNTHTLNWGNRIYCCSQSTSQREPISQPILLPNSDVKQDIQQEVVLFDSGIDDKIRGTDEVH